MPNIERRLHRIPCDTSDVCLIINTIHNQIWHNMVIMWVTLTLLQGPIHVHTTTYKGRKVVKNGKMDFIGLSGHHLVLVYTHSIAEKHCVEVQVWSQIYIMQLLRN